MKKLEKVGHLRLKRFVTLIRIILLIKKTATLILLIKIVRLIIQGSIVKTYFHKTLIQISNNSIQTIKKTKPLLKITRLS
jgi:hypothetical protein